MNSNTATPENVTQAAALNSPEMRPSAGSTSMAVTLTESHRELTPKTNDAADQMAHPNAVSEIRQFLAKPVAVWRGTWSTMTAAGTHLLNVPNVWASLYNQDVWVNKLKGYYGFRATLKLKLVLNCTPFQAGCLKLSYYPVGHRCPRKVSGHISHRVPVSQLPGIEIITAQEGVELSIPYIAPTRYIELTASTQVGWGSMFLTVMSPLATGTLGATTAGYTIWASFEDVELIGQTHVAPVAPQASRSKKLVYKRGAPPSEEELPPLASILAAGARLAGTLRVIPTVDAVAGTAEWVLNAGKSAALALGWSKPTSEGMMNMNDQPQRYGVTSDGVDTAIPLGMTADAKLSVIPGLYPSRQDEMSYRFICSQWSYWQEFTFTTTNVSGDQLAAYNLSPRGFRITVSPTERYMTPVAYLGFLHQFYHGGFEVMFKFSKTGFHTGSLAFTFVPGVGGVSPPTLDSGAYCYRSVLDLQEGDSVCYQLPWVIPLEYLRTAGASIGNLYVNVLNPLVAPETVAQNISVRVYIRGMDDLHFQAPVNDISANYPVTAQGGDTETFGNADCSPIGHAPTEGPTTAYAEAAASEMPISLRSLTKRYNLAQKNVLFWAGTPASMAILPFQWTCQTDPATTLTAPVLQDLRGSALAAPFAFYRGGRRLRMFGCDSTKLNLGSINFPQGGSAFVTAPTAQPAHSARTTNYANVSVPYTAVGRMCEIEWIANTSGVSSDFAPTRGVHLTSDPSAASFAEVVPSTTSFHLAGADDFEFFYWVGIPRMTNYEASS